MTRDVDFGHELNPANPSATNGQATSQPWPKNTDLARSMIEPSQGLVELIECIPTQQHAQSFRNGILVLAQKYPDLFRVRRQKIIQENEIVPSEDNSIKYSAVVIKSYARINEIHRALSNRHLATWIQSGRPVIFDISTESGIRGVDSWRSVMDILRHNKIHGGNIIFLQQNVKSHAELQQALIEQPGSPRIRVLELHFYLEQIHRSCLQDQDYSLPQPGREARYICLNHSARPLRAVMVGYLAKHQLLNNGLVSFPDQARIEKAYLNAAQRTGQAIAIDQFWQQTLDRHPAWADEIKICQSLVSPDGLKIANDTETPVGDHLPGLHSRALVSVVMETESTDTVLRFTEKSLQALANGHLTLIIGNHGVLSLLRRYGFQTFSPWIDESYDEISDLDERLRHCFAQVRRVLSMNEDHFKLLLEQTAEARQHNMQHARQGLATLTTEQMQRLHAAVLN